MFALKSLSVILAFSVFSTTAAPASSAIIARYDDIPVEVCSEPRFEGYCDIFSTPRSQCCKSKSTYLPYNASAKYRWVLIYSNYLVNVPDDTRVESIQIAGD